MGIRSRVFILSGIHYQLLHQATQPHQWNNTDIPLIYIFRLRISLRSITTNRNRFSLSGFSWRAMSSSSFLSSGVSQYIRSKLSPQRDDT